MTSIRLPLGFVKQMHTRTPCTNFVIIKERGIPKRENTIISPVFFEGNFSSIWPGPYPPAWRNRGSL
jgi:hypothetical protein